MKYKGYTGTIEVDEETKVLFGRVIGLRDMITFDGESFPELERAFHDSVDVYLDLCAKRGEAPEKPFSGRFIVRIEPALHRQLSDTAEASRLSLNSLIENILEGGVREPSKKPASTGARPKRPKKANGDKGGDPSSGTEPVRRKEKDKASHPLTGEQGKGR